MTCRGQGPPGIPRQWELRPGPGGPSGWRSLCRSHGPFGGGSVPACRGREAQGAGEGGRTEGHTVPPGGVLALLLLASLSCFVVARARSGEVAKVEAGEHSGGGGEGGRGVPAGAAPL